MALSRPTHPRVTQAVGRRVEYRDFCLRVVSLGSSEQRTPRNGRGVRFLMVLSWARPHLLRMVSRVTRNHASATAPRKHMPGSPDSLPDRRPTQRAPDVWESPRFQAVCVAGGGFRQKGVASSHPPAGNAPRWAADLHY
ncbi:MAG: hypothetical protein QM730_20730 [Anaerolineales bacterium]